MTFSNLFWLYLLMISYLTVGVAERESCSIPEDLPDTIKVLYEAEPSQEIPKGSNAVSGNTVIYRCQSQYVLQGNTTNICVDGKWSVGHPKCRKYCSPLSLTGALCEIFGETISCNQQLHPETRARISCPVGYQPVKDTHRCDEDGEWDYNAFRCIPICGVKAPNIVPYIVGGETTDIIKVPWHVGIFSNIVDKDVFNQICGGTIITAKLVVSAAHCFWDASENRIHEPANFKIGAGKSFRDFYAKEAIKPQILNVADIITVQEYRHFAGYYADDIALLILTDQLEFNSYIKPICLETDLPFNETYVTPGLVGKVAGWGLEASGGNSSSVLKYMELPVIEYNECRRTFTSELQPFITGDKFCAGYTTGQSVCQGDSGGGLIFPKEVGGTELYFLRGIVSTGGNKQGSCDNDKYTFFTNVQSHIKFVKYYKEQTYGEQRSCLVSEINTSECGKVDYIEPLEGGTETAKGKWPFIAALYYAEQSIFLCGASLISRQHILTGAHCVQEKRSVKKLLAEDVVVFLGVYNLNRQIEEGALQRPVDEIHVHPDWNAFSEKYDADVAILVLSKLVDYTNLIRPVCLPANDDDIIGDGVRGSIVGWGLSQNSTSRHVVIQTGAVANKLNDSYCYTTNHLIGSKSSLGICGGDEGELPNRCDSGSGFFVLYGTSDWVQYGIITSMNSDAIGETKADSISVYTKITPFKDWIAETVKTSGVCKKQVDLECIYNDDIRDGGIECDLLNLNITLKNVEVASFIGTNIAGFTAQNVTRIMFLDGNMIYIPDGIGKLFKNLQHFFLDGNLGLKLIKRSNFQNMTALESLSVRGNIIETVDEDTLYDLPNLHSFRIDRNKLKILHNNTFERNTMLNDVWANGNELEFLHKDLFKTNLMLTVVDFSDNKLEFLHRDLFKMNLLLNHAYFRNNKLKTILIDFAELKHIQILDFRGNICIDHEKYREVTNIQRLLNNQCGAV